MESEVVEQVIDEESQESEINVIPVQLVEPYEGVNLSSPSNSSHIARGKYYKQTYRTAWESMPDFKGWLRGVEGEPTRAYCTYCRKTLHAHRLSLLKHTCTIRHQKAAQIHGNRKGQMMEPQEIQTVLINTEEQEQEEETETIVEYTESAQELEEEQDSENDHEEEDEENEFQFHQQNSNSKAPISTHVVDTTRGTPIAGLQVSLYKLIDGRWTYINEGITNTAGRCSQFIDRDNFTPGRYKLHYDVDRYFESRKLESLFPFIEIVFDSSIYMGNYHIPILLSPYGYTVYRGS